MAHYSERTMSSKLDVTDENPLLDHYSYCTSNPIAFPIPFHIPILYGVSRATYSHPFVRRNNANPHPVKSTSAEHPTNPTNPTNQANPTNPSTVQYYKQYQAPSSVAYAQPNPLPLLQRSRPLPFLVLCPSSFIPEDLQSTGPVLLPVRKYRQWTLRTGGQILVDH